jgi:hypothetical protein
MSNLSFSSSSGEYRDPTLGEVNSFLLTYNNLLIFERPIQSDSSSVVRIPSNTIRIIDNFYSNGEEIEYFYDEENEDVPIGIASTIISGVSTTILPKKLYVIKISNIDIRVASTAENALSDPPKPLIINSLGVGQHKFISKNQNKKCLITLDNVIQSPVVSTGITASLNETITRFSPIFELDNISNFKGGDLIKIDNEYMKIYSVGVTTTGGISESKIKVERAVLGTPATAHSIGSTITKFQGNYNIIENILYFISAPYGNELDRLNENISGSDLEYTNLDVRSKFSGRVFLRSGIPLGNEEAYKTNYLFDSLNESFDGYKRSFTLTSNGENISDFSTDNSIILINDIIQTPSRLSGVPLENDFFIEESAGISSVTFVGAAASVSYDVNTSQLPRGGIIFSVGSTEGFGYQPLVSAGGTAIVSVAGTIQSIVIGNNGSGYRSGIQTSVRVGVRTESSQIEYIGIGSIQNGTIISVNITNPGSGYTMSSPPQVIFDSPLSYWNLPLRYSSSSQPGVGTEATIDVVVGQGSSVISFDIRNLGFGYKSGDILTFDIGGQVGVPTNTDLQFEEFKIFVTDVRNDEFNGWSLGELQVIDNIDTFFDGERKIFPISINGNRVSIRPRIGYDIDLSANLIITINNILQTPKKSYDIRGGSLISFTEPPKKEDKCRILFYRGTKDVDTRDFDILETIKEGDNVRIYDRLDELNQDFRTVEEVITSDTIRTNIYGGEGISTDQDLSRPMIWCRQTDDKFINGNEVTKDRIIYEPLIFPETYLIQPVSSSSTEFFVENIKTFFDSSNEYELSENFQDKILLLSQETLRPAIASPVVVSNSVSNIQIIDSGTGYTESPSITISSPIPIGSGSTCTASTSINSNGEITTITIVNPGSGYTPTNPPTAIIEEPSISYELIDDISYEGDFGSIIGIGTTSMGGGIFGIYFDFYIPVDSYIRDQLVNRVGIATTGISGIKTDYYFTISNSNIGNNIDSLKNDDTSIGVSTNFIDNVYQVYDYSIGLKNIPGIGVTYVNTILTKVSNLDGIDESFGEYFGDYSWGKIISLRRRSPKEFKSYPVGITSSTIVRRYNPLKYSNYFA